MQITSKIKFIFGFEYFEIDFSERKYSVRTTVLQFLRSLTDYKGTKEGCAQGDCGACSVVIADMDENGELKYTLYNSCLLLLPFLHNKQLITIEHLAENHELHPVQKAFIEHNASQCGYCTPGFVMAVFAFGKSNCLKTKSNIMAALSGNLCRCTGYEPIVDAALDYCNQNFADKFDIQKTDTVQKLKALHHEITDLQFNDGQISYFIPQSIDTALKIRKTEPDAMIISGGSDLVLQMQKQNNFISNLLDISRVAKLHKVVNKNNSVLVGAGLSVESLRMIVENTHPALFEMLSHFGSPQVRNSATIGGNILTASPIGDSLPVLMAYDAEVTCAYGNKKRKVKLTNFIVGYRKTDLQPDEIVIAVEIPYATDNRIVKSYKISKRKDLDISTISACFVLVLTNKKVSEIKIFFGGMAQTVKRAIETEIFITNKEWNINTVKEAAQILESEFTPISDVRAGEQARRLFASNLLIKFFEDT